jgi:hypothetical protein
MFESWLLLKITYTSSAAPKTQTTIVGYEHLTEAEQIFSQLQLSYRLDQPIRIKHDQMIKVVAISLYRVFKFKKKDAIVALEAGEGDLMYTAHGIPVEIG